MTKAKESKSEDGPTTESEIESLLTSAEVKSLLDELERERALRMRALADFDNYRKRVERERASAALSGKRDVMLWLLEVKDDFDRALAHADQSPDAVVAGLRAIRKRMADMIKAQGLTLIETVGRKFDPTLHEAVGVIEAGDGKPGTVLDEVSPGYLWNGEVLRPARVHVAK
ncbi:MAG TPA: nucleotide exchange factor GrpE [Blastocatellia bacterium]|nr:nucleotide exchange factor GrpE [Blastocatellia bacterium]